MDYTNYNNSVFSIFTKKMHYIIDMHLTLLLNIVERFDADLCVCHAVVVKVGAGGEALPTDEALVRFLSTVDASVSVQRA